MSDNKPATFILDERLDDDRLREETEAAIRSMVFNPPSSITNSSHVKSMSQYMSMYKESLDNPDKFWRAQASNLHFETQSEKGLEYNFDVRKGPIAIKFMSGAKTNVAYNCLERNVHNGLRDKVAFIWEGNQPEDSKQITYGQLLDQVSQFAAVLQSKGVKKGDRVAVYLPMILELPIAMLACARLGAMHSVVFGGFSAQSLASRILDAKSEVLLTADAFCRGSKVIVLKDIADQAIQICNSQGHSVKTCVVVRHIDRVTMHDIPKPKVAHNASVDVYWDECMAASGDKKANVEWLDSEDPLFMLYTSGSTGKPKGVVHSQSGYMLYTYATTKYVFDLQPDDVFWCTADCGWITGHSYIVYGPLLNGTTGIVFEGVPNHPDPGRYWQVCAKYKVNKFYTAPTAIRSLMAFKEEYVKKHDRSSLKVLGTVGEPINPAAWKWYNSVVGDGKCAIVDTYWQTETGGHVITPLPGATITKPGSATFPFFGVEPAIVDDKGAEIEGPGEGNLVLKRAWPGMARTIYGDHARFEKVYFSSFPGTYFTGDGAKRDADGYLWITGRVDDLMNVSGHLLSTAEIESALVGHPSVAEAAVVAAPHDVKGQVPYAFVTLRVGIEMSSSLSQELKNAVRTKIGAIAVPDTVQLAPGLPKTRSGKITRRILRKVAEGDRAADLGDTTTLADETVITQLWDGRSG